MINHSPTCLRLVATLVGQFRIIWMMNNMPPATSCFTLSKQLLFVNYTTYTFSCIAWLILCSWAIYPVVRVLNYRVDLVLGQGSSVVLINNDLSMWLWGTLHHIIRQSFHCSREWIIQSYWTANVTYLFIYILVPQQIWRFRRISHRNVNTFSVWFSLWSSCSEPVN